MGTSIPRSFGSRAVGQGKKNSSAPSPERDLHAHVLPAQVLMCYVTLTIFQSFSYFGFVFKAHLGHFEARHTTCLVRDCFS